MDVQKTHRPLRAGIAIKAEGGAGGYGTLTGIGRRLDNEQKVLVTCLHVVATEGYSVTGEDYIYQGGTGVEDRVGQLYRVYGDTGVLIRNSWTTVVPPVDGMPALGFNYGDFAALAPLIADQNVSFHVHTADPHEKRPIVFPTLPPKSGQKLLAVGATNGERLVEVGKVHTESDGAVLVGGYYFKEVVEILGLSSGGDSGSPLLATDGDGNLRLVAIHMSGRRKPEGYALKAAKAEEMLGIYFGVKAPVADAGAGGRVRPGQNFSLDGRRSKANEPGATISKYKWEQRHITAIPGKETDTATPTFTAPSNPTTLTFKLTVEDSNGAKASTSVNVKVKLADAGPPQTVNQGASVFLGPQGAGIAAVGSLTYTWKQIPVKGHSMPTVKLRGDKGPRPRFNAPSKAGQLKFHLTVTDRKKKITDTDEVEITVRAATPAPPPKTPAKPAPKPAPPLANPPRPLRLRR